MKKIDAHLHLAKVIAGYCARGESRAAGNGKVIWANGDCYQLIPEGLGEDSFLAETALELMDHNEVEKAVLMEGSLYGFQNEYYREVLKTYPGRFCPTVSADPFMTRHMEVIERFFRDEGFHTAKFEVSSGGGLMGANQAFVLSTCMMEICELVESYKGTIVLDMGDFMMDSHQPASIVRLAKRCPNLKIVVCHLCAPDRELHDEWVAELHMMKQDNVWFDISSVPKIMAPDVYPYPDAAAYLKEAKGIVGATRLMWGTDAPFAATQDSYEHLSDYLMKNGAFTDSELADVYYNNANEVYF